MKELRRDPITARWVILASDRTRRPTDYLVPREGPRAGLCPFCPGNEQRTPSELLARRPAEGPSARRDAPGWSLRVFPNRYPALGIEGDLSPEADGVYDRMNGIGAHEVVVETPDHPRQMADLGDEEVARVLGAWRDRVLDLRNDRRFRYVQIYKNHGVAAGASVDHAHSQLIALPVVPRTIVEELRGAEAWFQARERCVFCDIAQQEAAQRVRMVHENPEVVCFEPYASRSPFETWIVPRRHRAAFEESSPQELAGTAAAIRVALRKLRAALDDPPYNLVVHTAPLHQGGAAHYHWHIEIVPALAQAGGFELGTGLAINPTPPEEAAQFLRDLDGA